MFQTHQVGGCWQRGGVEVYLGLGQLVVMKHQLALLVVHADGVGLPISLVECQPGNLFRRVGSQAKGGSLAALSGFDHLFGRPGRFVETEHLHGIGRQVDGAGLAQVQVDRRGFDQVG